MIGAGPLKGQIASVGIADGPCAGDASGSTLFGVRRVSRPRRRPTRPPCSPLPDVGRESPPPYDVDAYSANGDGS